MNDHTCYNTDGSGIIGNASRVIFPKNNEEVQKAVSTNNNIVPRGAGTNLMGSVIPDNSLVICMKKMNLVGQLDKRNQIVYTEPGITIKELNEKLKSAGFELPLFTNNESTLGGMVARNELSDLSGYGHIKDYLEEVDLINSRGELFLKIIMIKDKIVYKIRFIYKIINWRQ
ncbi:hypothetical protein CMI42_03405 [Candidatus Pacearchaeota archaeon]|nr:hypothetical protein [Candidatus Pacearchaeota archaeon]